MFKHIFRAYDVRGIYGDDLDEDVMEKIGNVSRVFVKDAMIVGRDNRISSEGLQGAFISGLSKAGKDVIDIGVVPRGVCLFYAWRTHKTSAYITASHLPPEWNGVKFSDENGITFLEKENYKIRDMVQEEDFVLKRHGRIIRKNVVEEYKKHLLSKIHLAKPLKVLIDCGNGTAGLVAPDLFEGAGADVDCIFAEPDGSFPNRQSDVNDLSVLRKRMDGYDIGIAFDGDADRIALVDELGRVLNAEATSYLILKQLLPIEKGPIVANVECLRIIDKIARDFGRKVYRTRVGNAFMVQASLQKNACFGMERSGHYCIPSISPLDDGIVASLYAILSLSKMNKKLSSIVDEIPRYPFKRVDIPCPDSIKFKVVEELKQLLSKYKVNTADGIRIDFQKAWVLIRASNTSPLIRLTIEAETQEKLGKLKKKFLSVIEKKVKEHDQVL